MSEVCQESLPALFDALYKVGRDTSGEGLDSAATLVLKITRTLINEPSLMTDIAEELALILTTSDGVDQELELLQSIESIEQGLENQLRGFSSLMLWVLDDVSIRKDPQVMLAQVDGLADNLRAHFTSLCSMLLAYLELSEAFAVEVDKVASTLFLLGFTNILQEIQQKTSPEPLIICWLKERVKNQALASMYQDSLKDPYHLADFRKGHIMVALCVRVAQGGVVAPQEMAVLDNALKSVGMLGLAPLVEGGFLILEEYTAPQAAMRLVK